MAHSEQHILIIGAGLTGLLIARGLRAAGVAYTVFEREEVDYQGRKEWAMTVHWGLPYLESLVGPELAAQLVQATVDPSLDWNASPAYPGAIFDGVSGELVKRLDFEQKTYRLSRRKLRALLMRGIDVKFGHRLEKLSFPDGDTVIAHFTNVSCHKGTLAVGCDGPRSRVRECLFGEAQSQVQPMNGLVKLSSQFNFNTAEEAIAVRSIHPIMTLMVHPDLYMFISAQDVPDPAKPTDWTFYVLFTWIGDPDHEMSNAERVKLLKSRVGSSGIVEPYRSMIQNWPNDRILNDAGINYWFAVPFDTRGGRATLAGDAAHPMPPYRGQGLNNAILDAHRFVELVVNNSSKAFSVSKASLIQDFSGEVVRRGAEETQLTLTNARMLVDYHDVTNSPFFTVGLMRPIETV